MKNPEKLETAVRNKLKTRPICNRSVCPVCDCWHLECIRSCYSVVFDDPVHIDNDRNKKCVIGLAILLLIVNAADLIEQTEIVADFTSENISVADLLKKINIKSIKICLNDRPEIRSFFPPDFDPSDLDGSPVYAISCFWN